MTSKTYAQACQHPAGGAVAMDEDNLRAEAAQILGRAHGFQPERIYHWAQTHHIDLVTTGSYWAKPESRWELFDCITNSHKDRKVLRP